MTRIPGLEWRNIPPGDNDPAIVPIGIVLHVAVSEARSLHDFFSGPSGGIESHGYIRRDGSGEQYRSTDIEADAQSQGNSFTVDGRRFGFISLETQGMGDGPWTDQQLATIQRIVLWAHQHYAVPLRVCPSPFAGGVGYHSLFKAWNPNSHSCPGPDRIQQFHDVLAPWLAHPQEDDMQLSDKITIDGKDFTVEQVLRNMILNARRDAGRDGNLAAEFKEQAETLGQQVAAIAAKVDSLSTGGVDVDALLDKLAARLAQK